MQGWMDGFQASIDYIEAHLTEPMDIGSIASMAALSPFYYQRIFGALCGMTVGDYVRARRMTLAAQALAGSEAKVIDVALEYGYDAPDSFARAFQRFHGILPSRAKEPGAPLRAFAPLHIKLTLEGGNMLEYRIVEKAPFTIVGARRRFNTDTSYREIPEYWEEWMAKGSPIMGKFGFCADVDGQDFDYWIADLYAPWEDVPEGCETRAIPGGLWAEFPCRGPLPDSLQSVNTRIWSEWLPGLKGYALAGNYNLEVYSPPAENPEDDVNTIWIPLKKA